MYQGGPFPSRPAYSGPPPGFDHGGGSAWPPNPSPQPAFHHGNVAAGSILRVPLPTDPEGFGHTYHSFLRSLTFNSKPLITDLTVLAQDHVHRMANVMAQCIDEHILQCPPAHRLPALYVLDSISKNVGAPYTDLWGQRIAHLYLESYRLVDQPTKVRMEELLNTWRNGGPNGKPLFGGDAQWAIERSLYGSNGVPGGPSPTRPAASPVPPPRAAEPQSNERTRAVEQIGRLLALGSQDQYKNPQAFNPTRMSALKQLKTVVQTATLSPSEMSQIQNQLNSLAAEFERARSESSQPPPMPQSSPPPQQPTGPALSPPAPVNGTGPSPLPAALPSNLTDALASLTQQGVLPPPAAPTPPFPQANQQPTTSAPPSNDLFQSLMAAGLLRPPTASAPQAAVATKQDDAYASAILSLDLRLASADLQKELSRDAVELVCHKHLPLQCRQCANRYPPGPHGQRSLEKHLDWHFRQGRRAKDAAGRGMSRAWLDLATEWIRGGQDDPSASGKSGQDASSSASKGLSAQQEAELKAASDAWVPAPTEAELANAPCPICKEKFQSEWCEDEEEWIWKNAKKVEGSYYHGSCHYSAKVLSNTAATRTTTPPGRRTAERRSRTVTPPVKRIPDPVERLRAEEGGSKKRKESPLATEEGQASMGGAGHDDKRVAA